MRSILDQLRITVAEHGDWPAVVDQDGTTTTYAQLDELSSRVANSLVKLGIGIEDTIAIKMPRCMEYLAAELAVMKAGAAYVPLHESLAQERVDVNVAECKCKLLITPREFRVLAREEPLPPEQWVRAGEHDIAFVCYSSGSTGNPKAAAQEYGCYDLILAAEDEVLLPFMEQPDGTRKPLRKALPSAFIFISSVMIVMSSVYHECILYLPPDEILRDMDALAQYFRDNQIEYVYMTSSSIRKLQDMENLPLRTTHTGAEVASGLANTNFEILNCYSMSELGYIVCGFDITEPLEVTPVGKPKLGTELVLINANHEVVDDIGILCVCVPYFRGYLGLPGRNRESFVEIGGRWFFITNDIAEVDADGVYTIRGRHDDTIEIAGRLVEPSQVEAEVQRLFPELGPVAARGFHDEDQNGYLAVYYVADEVIPVEEFRRRFVGRAKPYLLPRVFVRVDEFPLTSSGKIARRVLDMPLAPEFELGEL